MSRIPVVLESEGQQVFGVFHRPAGTIVPPYPATLILHGFLGSKDQPHRVFVSLADALAAVGIAALRIDLRGRGDSAGKSIDITPQADLEDARNALDFLTVQPDVDPARLGVLGLSWGGTLAACLAGRDPRVGPAVIWNAAGEVHTWDPPLSDYGGRQAVELWGNLVGEGFNAGVRHVFPLEAIKTARGPVLVVQSTADEAVPDPQAAARRLDEILTGAGIAHDLHFIEGADHTLMGHAWRQEAIDHSVAWLRVALRAVLHGAA